MDSGLVFIMSHIDIEGELPIEIIKDHCIRRASDEQISSIRNYLEQLRGGRPGFFWPRYDSLVKEERYEGKTSYHFKELPKEQWKYWVITFEGYNHHIHDIEYVALLLENDLDFGFTFIYNKPSQQGEIYATSLPGFNIYNKYTSSDIATSNAITIKSKELESIGTYYSWYKDIPEEYNFIEHAVKNFSSLRSIPRGSELIVVGYFSIIESLVTHPPRLTETLDSISHQLRNKMILLGKRFSRKINPESYFLPINTEQLWSKLYGYRSCLAHGSKANFQNNFRALKNQDMIVAFLKENIKELLLLSMQQPEFINDLKKC
ncbi:MAG TPA: hypothetical protein ENH40_01000 [Nitrospirae bacterium]|nr:hypothetical protein [Nitrospirota bacterium]